MSQQITIDFQTDSPINISKLSGQNKEIYYYMKKGNWITRYEAEKLFRVGNLHSRISDLKNKFKIAVKSELIKVLDYFGRETYVKKYWLETDNTGN